MASGSIPNDSLVCPVRYEVNLHEPEEHASHVTVSKWLDYRCKEVQFFDTKVAKRRFRDYCLKILSQQEKEIAQLSNQQAHGGTP